jgi:hypothetical protein
MMPMAAGRLLAICLTAWPCLVLAQGRSAPQDAPKAAAPDGAPAQEPAKAPPKKLVLKKTGQVIYKCGDTFTDQPVCPDQTKPLRVKRSAEDVERCEQFKRTNYYPWYCKK